MVVLRRLILNFLSVNCYFVSDADTGRTLIVDPGSSESRIFDFVEKNGLKPEGILLTHAHVDHISAVPEVSRKYAIPVWLHKADIPLYFSPDNALRPWMETAEGLPEPVEQCPTAGINFRIIHTPGHSPGSVCFYFEEDGFVLSGDTLFQGTYGRTDFQGGSTEAIFNSIGKKLLTLPENVIVYPGHEGATTIRDERNNPLFSHCIG